MIGQAMSKHAWIAEVLGDLHSYAVENSLSGIARSIENAVFAPEKDIGKIAEVGQLKARFEPRPEAPAHHG